MVTIRGVGHASSPTGSALDPASLAFARSGFRLSPPEITHDTKSPRITWDFLVV
ncbi:MAG: hypothetical protein WCV79_01355 [Candidatus Paceibacterota bacterium]